MRFNPISHSTISCDIHTLPDSKMVFEEERKLHTLEPENPLNRVTSDRTSDSNGSTCEDSDVADWFNERRTDDENFLRMFYGSSFIPGLTSINSTILLTNVTDVHVANNISTDAAFCCMFAKRSKEEK